MFAQVSPPGDGEWVAGWTSCEHQKEVINDINTIHHQPFPSNRLQTKALKHMHLSLFQFKFGQQMLPTDNQVTDWRTVLTQRLQNR